tara:strand:+ start:3328 stop:3945 length:618 start_codon:yes stop_codon:yes gene_type:complete
MSTIVVIDRNHLESHAGENEAVLVFKPELYKTYGAARKAIQDLLDSIGYENLSQLEKEIVGRWNLITDQQELDNLFSSSEQQQIIDLHNSYVKSLHSGQIKKTSSSQYIQVDVIIYKGSLSNQILNCLVATSCSNTDTIYSVRLYDETNFQILFEKTGLNNTDFELIDLGIPLNQPTTDALLELQIKKTNGSGNIRYDSSVIDYI